MSLDCLLTFSRCRDAEEADKKILEWLPRLHSLVIGPGLGRNKELWASVIRVSL